MTKEILLLLIIIMTMQNKLYMIQFFSLPNDQLHNQSLSSDPRICGFP